MFEASQPLYENNVEKDHGNAYGVPTVSGMCQKFVGV